MLDSRVFGISQIPSFSFVSSVPSGTINLRGGVEHVLDALCGRLALLAAGFVMAGGSMKSLICAALVAYGLAAAGHAAAQADLAKKDGCTNCHDVATKKVGPSFKDIAAKYKGNASAETHLIVKISTGTSPESSREAGVHPQVKASLDDVKSLVKWILSM